MVLPGNAEPRGGAVDWLMLRSVGLLREAPVTPASIIRSEINAAKGNRVARLLSFICRA